MFQVSRVLTVNTAMMGCQDSVSGQRGANTEQIEWNLFQILQKIKPSVCSALVLMIFTETSELLFDDPQQSKQKY